MLRILEAILMGYDDIICDQLLGKCGKGKVP
jgi:hypothetical protein